MTRFHFTFDSSDDDAEEAQQELVYSDDDDDENDAPEQHESSNDHCSSHWNVKGTSRYALEYRDTALVDSSLVEYSQYPSVPHVAQERVAIVPSGRNAETASIPALCQLSLCSPRYDTPWIATNTALTPRPQDLRRADDISSSSYNRDMWEIVRRLRQIPPMPVRRCIMPRPTSDDDEVMAPQSPVCHIVPRLPSSTSEDEDIKVVRQLRHQLEQQHAAAQDALQKLLQRAAETAAKIQKAEQALRRQQQAEAEQAEQEAALQREEQETLQRQEKEREEAAAARTPQEEAVESKTTPPRSRPSKESSSSSPGGGKSPVRKSSSSSQDEHVARAFKLRTQLVDVQQSVADFETSPLVKDRRLSYKKLVNGRINTLAENVHKIMEVARDVEQAIATARQADETNKTAASSKSDCTILGKRYLVNLLASKVMVRAQAEGFNGQRGDGFPLAHMLCLVAAKVKDVIPVLSAHIYTVCPTAIPVLPASSESDDSNEDAFMEQLGMMRDKEGRFESFERFLSRTEGLISLVANIMASEPSEHLLMGGHSGAIKWLQRFLALLPEAPQSPLPLLTAPVLDAFLTGAGHMMANVHTDAFRELLDVITNDVCLRLDESAIGMPSATRLRKTIRVGLKGFQETLPSRALPELYYGADKSKTSDHTAFSSLPPPEGDSGPADSMGSNNNYSTDWRAPCKFFAEGRCRNGDNCNFSHDLSNNNNNTSSSGGAFGSSAPAPFGSGGATTHSPFGSSAPAAASPFGPPIGTGAPAAFGSGAPAPTPFGTGAPTPFGSPSGTNAPSSSAFGSGGSAPAPFGSPFGTAAPAPAFFGSATPAPTPFGSGAPAPSPFGSPFGTAAPAPAAFGSGAPAPTPFGSGASAPSTFGSPFGTTAPAPAAFGSGGPAPAPFGSPTGQNTQAPGPFSFGGNSATSSTPFGAASTPFGGGSTPQQQTSPFAAPTPGSSSLFGTQPSSSAFGSASSTFGMSTNSASSSSTPFGNAQQSVLSPSPFGSPSPAPTPFGSAAAPFGGTPAPFGSTPAPSIFGGSGMTTNPSPFSTSTTSPFGGGFGIAANQVSNSPFSSGFSQQQGPQSTFGQTSQQPSTMFGAGLQGGGVFGQGGTASGDNRPPCKYFAKGQCRYGANCNFSHGSQSTTFGGTMNSPFGAPRR